jgi:phage tail tape-measure protein
MASLGDLVVKIGADTRDLNKQLGKVQRELRGMTGNITQLGKNMTRSITLPLAALGAAAVKSAADLETLETSFISLTGGAEQASMMVQQLNKFTAETPFQLEQVGKAARQLIAVRALTRLIRSYNFWEILRQLVAVALTR